MAKITTVLTTFVYLTAAPADSVFPVDGDWGEILVNLTAFAGSAPTLETSVVQVDKTLVLAYDGQTANFTVGKRVRGSTSNATGQIVRDVDGGATGTLTLKGVVGKFKDNEPLTEEFGDGVAVVNSATGGTVTFVELGTWATTGTLAAGASVTREILVDPDGSSDVARPVVPGLYRLKFAAGGGAITDLDGNVTFTTSL